MLIRGEGITLLSAPQHITPLITCQIPLRVEISKPTRYIDETVDKN